jgi:hypothetical protein
VVVGSRLPEEELKVVGVLPLETFVKSIIELSRIRFVRKVILMDV